MPADGGPHRRPVLLALPLCLALALAACLAAPSALAGAPAPVPPGAAPLSFEVANATQLFPNQSATGSISAGGSALFKVFANRSDAAPESLTVTLEATGSLFGTGTLSIFDPLELLLDEKSTTGPGQIQFANILAFQTGFYLLEVRSSQVYDWALTVNLSVGSAFPLDNDNDLSNATPLAPPSGQVLSNLTDFQDLFDTYSVDLNVSGNSRQALIVNLSAPGFDFDLFVFHMEAGRALLDTQSISPTGFEYASALPNASGRFYVRVLSYAGSAAYTLQWAVLPVNADPNGSPTTATALPSGHSPNNLSRWDLVDFYRLDLTANTTVNISLTTQGFNATSREPDLQAVLWDASIQRVTWSFDFDPDERINFLAPQGGTYFLEVFAANFSYYLLTALTFNYTMDARVDPPPALFDPAWNATLQEDQPASFDLTGLVGPDPVGEGLVFSLGAVEGPLSASLDLDGRTLHLAPDPDAFGDGSVTVTARDAWAAVEFVLPVHILPVNDPPRLRGGAGALAFDEDSQGLFDPALAFFDPEGDPFSLTAFSGEGALSATLISQGISLLPPPNGSGPFRLSVTVEDSRGASASVAVQVTVRPVNDGPFFPAPPPTFELDEDAPSEQAGFNLSGFAFDPEGDPITYSLQGADTLASLVVGNWIYLHPAPDFAGNLSASLRASDGSLSASTSVVIRVRPIDDPPTLLLPQGPAAGAEGAPFSFAADASDIDSPLSSLTFAFVLDGRPVQNASRLPSFSFAFDFESAGTHVLRVTVSDGERAASGDLIVVVAPTNRPPLAQILAPAATGARAGSPTAFSGRGLDLDGDKLNFSWIVDGTQVSNAPAFSLDGLGPGHHTVDLRVSDGELAATASSTFEVGAPTPGFQGALTLLVLALLGVVAARRPPSKNSIDHPKRLK